MRRRPSPDRTPQVTHSPESIGAAARAGRFRVNQHFMAHVPYHCGDIANFPAGSVTQIALDILVERGVVSPLDGGRACDNCGAKASWRITSDSDMWLNTDYICDACHAKFVVGAMCPACCNVDQTDATGITWEGNVCHVCKYGTNDGENRITVEAL